MKKGQVSIEFVVIIVISLTLAFVFAAQIFNTTDSIKSIAKIKLKTLDLITVNDSDAVLLKIENSIVDSNLNLKLFITNLPSLNLSDQNYSDVISNIKETTFYENVNLSFESS